MRVLAILLAVIQFSFAFHALKTGRGRKWIMIIIIAPVIGCLAYYFMEVFPHSREERQLRRTIRDIARAINPDGELKRRAKTLGTKKQGAAAPAKATSGLKRLVRRVRRPAKRPD